MRKTRRHGRGHSWYSWCSLHPYLLRCLSRLWRHVSRRFRHATRHCRKFLVCRRHGRSRPIHGRTCWERFLASSQCLVRLTRDVSGRHRDVRGRIKCISKLCRVISGPLNPTVEFFRHQTVRQLRNILDEPVRQFLWKHPLCVGRMTTSMVHVASTPPPCLGSWTSHEHVFPSQIRDANPTRCSLPKILVGPWFRCPPNWQWSQSTWKNLSNVM